MLDLLREHRLLAILRGRDRAATVAAGLTLIDAGVRCLEVSLSGADALAALGELCRAAGADAHIGAGTVLTAADVEQARDAGAEFVVTPGACPGIAAAHERGLPVLGGALTPSEIIAASARCAAVKLFPASVGGVGYLRAIRAPLPEVPLVPVGGVDAELARRYLAAGAVAVGVSSPLVGDAADGGDLGGLRARARTFLAAVTG